MRIPALIIAVACFAGAPLLAAAPAEAQEVREAQEAEQNRISRAVAQQQDAEPPAEAQPLRGVRLQALPAQRATPVERRTYHTSWRDLAAPGAQPQYTCDHNASGEAVSCWCNFNDSPQDCANMLVNYCGDAPTWTSDVPGELGCDSGTG